MVEGFPPRSPAPRARDGGSRRRRVSRTLSLMLRHHPERFGVEVDSGGWADVNEVIDGLERHGLDVDRAFLEEVVETNDKQRFAFTPDGRRIRANQGHSLDVDLGLDPVTPPATLFHGTVVKFLDSIRTGGLNRGSRRHVHLSGDVETATTVGGRRGRPIVLTIAAALMAADGHAFYLSANGVWLTERVPVEYLTFPG